MAQTMVTAPRPAAVAAVLNRSHQWVSARRKIDGTRFFYIPGSMAGSVYMANENSCTCPSAQHRSGPCKHVAAVRQHQVRQTAQAPAPKPAPRMKSYSELFPNDD
jgi:predicted nucleic acid-binding Zn finger protein